MKKILKAFLEIYKNFIWFLRSKILTLVWAKVGTWIKYNSSIISQSSLDNISFWNNVWIGKGVVFNGKNCIDIWNDVLVSDYCAILSTDHEFKDISKPIRLQWYTSWEEQKVEIWDWVWIGFNVIIMKWVKIGENAIIWAGSVVTKNIEANSIYAWVPAKFIKKRAN